MYLMLGFTSAELVYMSHKDGALKGAPLAAALCYAASALAWPVLYLIMTGGLVWMRVAGRRVQRVKGPWS